VGLVADSSGRCCAVSRPSNGTGVGRRLTTGRRSGLCPARPARTTGPAEAPQVGHVGAGSRGYRWRPAGRSCSSRSSSPTSSSAAERRFRGQRPSVGAPLRRGAVELDVQDRSTPIMPPAGTVDGGTRRRRRGQLVQDRPMTAAAWSARGARPAAHRRCCCSRIRAAPSRRSTGRRGPARRHARSRALCGRPRPA
jgi:hypothetical protein